MKTPKRRRILSASLIAMLLPAAGLVAAGLLPMAEDRPALPAATHVPGDGGLRRPFPAMAVRAHDEPVPARVALGRLLFFDPILSGANDVSCATCHHPDLGLSDGRGQAMGKGGTGIGPARTGGHVVKRGSPSLWNAGYNHRQFWDGRASDLEDQARFPLTSPHEMDQKADELPGELQAVPEYVRLFGEAFPGSPRPADAVTVENVARAVAAFERTLVSDRSRFDRYRAGEAQALTASERRGLTLFRSLKTRCFECHGFPTFANPDFKVVGVPDVPGQEADLGRAEVAGGKPYEHAFKVPSLRNVARTPPYMHNGRFATLREVILFYQQGGGRGQGLDLPNLDDKIRPFALTIEEQDDLIAFLESLTDESRVPAIPDRVPSGLPVVPHLPGGPVAANSLPTPVPVAVPGSPRTHTVEPGASIQAAIDAARPGDVIEVRPGTYRESLLVDVDRITLRGLVKDEARPVLEGDGEKTDAVIASGHGFAIEGFRVHGYTSNGITVHGATGVVFRDLQVEDTGLYGVYPVECKDVLVERVLVTGARDAAIYVGQSRDIVVRGNEVRGNVTGIEIENSSNAVVEDNFAHDNTGGILVFLLPNNPSKVGENTRVARNRVVGNNHRNFGDPGSIVSQVPVGAGVFVMAADRTEIVDNEIAGNDSFGIAVVSLAQAFPKGTVFDVGPIPEGNLVRGNRFAANGRNPAPAVKAITGRGVDILWDGSGADNVFAQPGAATFPPWLPDRNWPAFASRAWSRLVTTLAAWLG
jgi:parallel beta-helix repeat protein